MTGDVTPELSREVAHPFLLLREKARMRADQNNWLTALDVTMVQRMGDIGRARQLRKAETWAEKLMWRWLRDRRFSGYRVRRQHPASVYFLDFFCEEARLAIELDGFGHGHPDQRRHDSERESFLASRSIKVLRFWNSSLRRNGQSIRDTIFQALQEQAPHPLPSYTRPMARPGSREQNGG